MARLAIIVLSSAAVLAVAGIAVMSSSPSQDPGERFTPTSFGVGIMLLSGGVTLALIVAGFALWFGPTLRKMSELRKVRPGDLTFVAQRSPSLSAAIAEIGGADASVPSYFAVAASASSLEFWSASDRIISISTSNIGQISQGLTTTSRAVPSIRLGVSRPEAATVVLEIVPSREGLELFPVLDVTRVDSLVDALKRKSHPTSD